MEEYAKLTPSIALVGRTNVGKSTLFNRLIEKRKAITSYTEGTTQDINFDHCHWRDQIITVIDTAGLDLTSDKATEDRLKHQAEMAMEKADIIIMMVDVQAGLMPQDEAMAKYLRKKNNSKKILLVANKADNPHNRKKAKGNEWLKLGMKEPLPVSAANGSGVGDLLDIILDDLKERGLTSRPLPEPHSRIALIGRPNAGKSSLLNALAGEDRVIVSEVPHTTKEPQDTMLTYIEPDGTEKYILVVDTVGIRKKARVERGIEKIGVSLSVDELYRADVAFLMIDANEGIGIQERKLAGLIERKNTGVLIIINKWDLADEENQGSGDEYKLKVKQDLPFFKYAPIAFISAKTGNRVGKLLKYALEIVEQRRREIPQEDLDKFVELLKKKHHAVIGKAKESNRAKVYGIKQVGTEPPTFMIVANKRENVHENFLRFVENRLREQFGFEGTDIKVLSREIESKPRK